LTPSIQLGRHPSSPLLLTRRGPVSGPSSMPFWMVSAMSPGRSAVDAVDYPLSTVYRYLSSKLIIDGLYRATHGIHGNVDIVGFSPIDHHQRHDLRRQRGSPTQNRIDIAPAQSAGWSCLPHKTPRRRRHQTSGGGVREHFTPTLFNRPHLDGPADHLIEYFWVPSV